MTIVRTLPVKSVIGAIFDIEHFLLSHEADIASSVNDFGELSRLFRALFGRDASIEDKANANI